MSVEMVQNLIENLPPFGTSACQICHQNIAPKIHEFGCIFLVSSFAQKLVPIGRPIFDLETGQYFEKISEPVVRKVERFEVSPKAFSCVKFCRHHFEKFLFIFVKSDSSAKHSTSEFCFKNLEQNCSENFGQKYTF